MTNYIFLLHAFLGGLLGIVAHASFKYDSLRKLSKKAGTPFSLHTYVDNEITSFLTAIITVFILLFVAKEILNAYPAAANWIRVLSVLIGWMGNRLLQRAMGNTEKNLLNIIDKKTNIADKFTSGENVTAEDIKDLDEAKDTINLKK
jgi:hypothetical protein